MVEDRCSLYAMFATILADLKRKEKQRKFLHSVKNKRKKRKRKRRKRKNNILKLRKLINGRYIK